MECVTAWLDSLSRAMKTCWEKAHKDLAYERSPEVITNKLAKRKLLFLIKYKSQESTKLNVMNTTKINIPE